MIIPRERDIVRFYTQLSEMDAQEVINVSGRVDLTKWTPAKLLKVCPIMTASTARDSFFSITI